MAVVEVTPFLMKDVVLTLTPAAPGTEGSFQKHVSQVEFVPSASQVDWKGLSPSAVFTFPTAATWTCNLSYAQDWSSPDSLSRFLYDHEGETVAATFEPTSGVGTSWAADLIIVPGSIGGTVDSVAVGTVALGVQGKPVPTAIP